MGMFSRLFVQMLLRLEVFRVLDGPDFYVGIFAIFVEAESSDPNFAVTKHDALRVDEESFVFLLKNYVGDVGGDDAVVVFDKSLWGFNGDGVFAGVDLDGVVDEGSDGGSIVLRNGCLKVGEETFDLDVTSDGEIDGFVQVGWGGLRGAMDSRDE
jgi:hypothetical protein